MAMKPDSDGAEGCSSGNDGEMYNHGNGGEW